MCMKRWSRPLLTVGLLSLSLLALPAAAADEAGSEEGTLVNVKLPAGGGELPDPEKVVESLLAKGGKHIVKVERRKDDAQDVMSLKIWGPMVPASDIQGTLREAFPVLARADIQVSAVPASEKPKLEEGVRGGDGTRRVKKVIKKEVDTQEKAQQ